MPSVSQLVLFLLACFLTTVYGLKNNAGLHSNVKTVSEGTDCRCRCVLKKEEGEPCENDPSKKKTILSVESVSGGSDCKCSCLTHLPPDDCGIYSTDANQPNRANEAAVENAKINVPLAENLMGNTIALTISGTLNTSESLMRSGSFDDVLRRAIIGLKVMKIHSSVKTIVSALTELDEALEANLTAKMEELQQKISKAAAGLPKERDNRGEEVSTNHSSNENTSSAGYEEEKVLLPSNRLTSANENMIPKASTASHATTDDITENFDFTNNITLAPSVASSEEKNTDKKILSKLLNSTNISDRRREKNISQSTMTTTVSNEKMFDNQDRNLNITLLTALNDSSNSEIKTIHNKSTEIILSNSSLATISVQTTPKYSAATTVAFQPSLSQSEQSSSSKVPKSSERWNNSANKSQKFQSLKNPSTTEAHKHVVSSATKRVSASETASSGKRVSQISVGKLELYRNKETKAANVKNEKPRTAENYYDHYYDYADTDTKSAVVRPPIVRTQESKFENFEKANHRTTGTQMNIEVSTTTSKSVESTTGSVTTRSTSTSEENYDEYYDDYEDFTTKTSSTTTSTTTTTTTTTTSPQVESCGTLFNLSKPKLVHDFGRREGAWLKDAAAKPRDRNKIYVTNFYYGNNLIEFDSLRKFKSFRWSKSYMLPYNWIGTGHIVYNGSFYYNRAFSRTLIKYDLKYRFVSAWAHLRSAIYDSSTPFTWRGHTNVHMAADETGFWVIYPAYNDFSGYNSESYVINKVNPIDLRTITSWRTSLQRNSVSHVFMVCGVVYATDRYNYRRARITYAYDTHSRERQSLYLPFYNKYAFNVQLQYYHKEKKLMSWDKGHQLFYDVNMTH